MSLTLCTDVSPADWITGSELSWVQLVGFGPSGYAAYARLLFLPDPAYEGQSENDVDLPDDAPGADELWGRALDVLARHTSTPDDCYVCLWEGFGELYGSSVGSSIGVFTSTGIADGDPPPDARPGLAPRLRRRRRHDRTVEVPKVVVPAREFYLFHGPLAAAGDWGEASPYNGIHLGRRFDPEPAFVWPADRAWCIARDVDPHWAGIGASQLAIDELIADPALDVVPADPAGIQPAYGY